MTDAYIYDALRSPRGKGRKDGSLHEVTSLRLSAQILNAVKDRNGLDGHAVEDVIWGNVTQVGEQGGCLARSAVLASDLDERIPGLSINRFCASGMEAVNLAANQVRGGAGRAYIAGGVEMMGRVAMGSDGAAIAVDPSLAMEISTSSSMPVMPTTAVEACAGGRRRGLNEYEGKWRRHGWGRRMYVQWCEPRRHEPPAGSSMLRRGDVGVRSSA